MQIPQPKTPFRIITFVLLLINGVVVNSCRKDNKNSLQSLTPEVNQAKAWYESSFPVNSSGSKLITQSINGVNVAVANLSQLITPGNLYTFR